jgi:hypothetical protein
VHQLLTEARDVQKGVVGRRSDDEARGARDVHLDAVGQAGAQCLAQLARCLAEVGGAGQRHEGLRGSAVVGGAVEQGRIR